MYLRGCFEGVSKAAILDNMGFAVDVSRARTITPPSTEELSILRERCDPQRLILG
jgi:glutaconate CoA-transferase, subunit B